MTAMHAGTAPPPYPVPGEAYYNTMNNTVYVFAAARWFPIVGVDEDEMIFRKLSGLPVGEE